MRRAKISVNWKNPVKTPENSEDDQAAGGARLGARRKSNREKMADSKIGREKSKAATKMTIAAAVSAVLTLP